MTELLFFRVLISFFVGGAVISLATYLAQIFGSKIGGLISGFPTIIFVSLLFIGIYLGEEAAQEASLSTLVSLSFFGVFCSVFVSFYKRNAWFAAFLALLSWFCLATGFSFFQVDEFYQALSLFLLIASAGYFFLKTQNVPNAHSNNIPRPFWTHILRFMLGGVTVGGAVLLSIILGEHVGGIFASFPSMGVSAIIILKLIEGDDFTASFTKNIFFGAMVNCSTFIIAVHFTYPLLGVAFGTIVSIIIAVISASLLVYFKREKPS